MSHLPHLFGTPHRAFDSRREFLRRAGAGFGTVALTALLEQEGLLQRGRVGRRRRQCRRSGRRQSLAQSARAAAQPFSGQGQERDLAVHERRAQPGRYLGLQAGAGEARRQGTGRLRQEHRLFHRAGRPADEVALQVRAARPVGRLGLGDLSEHGRTRRRHGVHPFLLHGHQQPFAGPVRDQHRHEPHGLSLRRRVGHVRPGHRESEPAGLRRDVRHARPRLAQGTRPELGHRLPARRVSRHGPQCPRRADQQPVAQPAT